MIITPSDDPLEFRFAVYMHEADMQALQALVSRAKPRGWSAQQHERIKRALADSWSDMTPVPQK